jgi:hypothetical protein
MITSTVFAEDADFYITLFNKDRGGDPVRLLRIVQTVQDSSIENPEVFYASALHTIVQTYPNIRGKGGTQLYATDECIRLLSNELAEKPVPEAVSDLWKASQYAYDPQARAAALIALGKAGAMDYLVRVVGTLKELNAGSMEDPLARERVARGAMTSLENYKDPMGYIPVFETLTGGYTTRIRDQAENTLSVLAEDPSEPLIEIISGSHPIELQYEALKTIEASSVSDDSKKKAAAAALTTGWTGISSNNIVRKKQDMLRKLAIDMIGRYGAEDDSVYPLLRLSYTSITRVDVEEQLAAIGALGQLGTEQAVAMLISFVADINEKAANYGIDPREEQLIRVLIPTLGAVGGSNAEPILRTVLAENWTAVVHKLAKDALDKSQAK